ALETAEEPERQRGTWGGERRPHAREGARGTAEDVQGRGAQAAEHGNELTRHVVRRPAAREEVVERGREALLRDQFLLQHGLEQVVGGPVGTDRKSVV